MNYPASLCVSLNNEVIHGIPGPRKLRQGDIVSIDLGVDLNGYFSDAAITIGVGATTRKRERLMKITRECLERGVAQALPGNRISDISRAVYEHAVAPRAAASCGNTAVTARVCDARGSSDSQLRRVSGPIRA